VEASGALGSVWAGLRLANGLEIGSAAWYNGGGGWSGAASYGDHLSEASSRKGKSEDGAELHVDGSWNECVVKECVVLK